MKLRVKPLLRRKEATGWKVVAASPSNHYYSFATGICYSTLQGRLPKLVMQYRLSRSIPSNLLVKGSRSYNYLMQGRTFIFKHKRLAEHMTANITLFSDLYRTGWTIKVVKAVVWDGLLKGSFRFYDQSNYQPITKATVFAGRRIEFLE